MFNQKTESYLKGYRFVISDVKLKLFPKGSDNSLHLHMKLGQKFNKEDLSPHDLFPCAECGLYFLNSSIFPSYQKSTLPQLAPHYFHQIDCLPPFSQPIIPMCLCFKDTRSFCHSIHRLSVTQPSSFPPS